jgi:hypothetical protein
MQKSEKLDAMWKHLCELENNLLRFKLITEEEAVGKNVVRIMDKWMDGYNHDLHNIIIIFDDNTALYFDGDYFSTHPILYDSHCDYSKYKDDIECWAYMRDFGIWMIEEGFIRQEDADAFLEAAKEYRMAQYQEKIEDAIREKEDEIEKLKAQRL